MTSVLQPFNLPPAEENVTEIVEALQAIYNPATPNEQRLMFSQKLEVMKERLTPAAALQLAFQLCEHEDVVVRHLGWHIIEHVIRYKWPEVDYELRINLKNQLIQEILSARHYAATQDIHHDQSGVSPQIKMALCRCVVNVVEHDWPQQWPDLLPTLQQVLEQPCSPAASSPNKSAPPQSTLPSAMQTAYAKCEMVLLILGRLVEDVQTMRSTAVEDSPRLKELQNALKTNANTMLEMCLARLHRCMLERGKGVVGAGDELALLSLAGTTLELTGAIVEWMPAGGLEEMIDTLVDVVAPFLLCSPTNADTEGSSQQKADRVCVEAAKCFRTIAGRRCGRNHETVIVFSMLRDQPIRLIEKALECASLRQRQSDEEECIQLTALCELTSTLGVHIADVWSHFGGVHPPNFPFFVAMEASLFANGPSILARSEAAQVIAHYAANPVISSSPDFISAMQRWVLPSIPTNLNRQAVTTATMASISGRNSIADCDNPAEESEARAYAGLRMRCCKLLQDSMPRHSPTLISMMDSWLVGVFQPPDQANTMPHTITMRKLVLGADEKDALKRYLNSLVDAVYKQGQESRGGEIITTQMAMKHSLQAAFSLVLSAVGALISDGQLETTNKALSILSALFPTLNDNAAAIPPLLAVFKEILRLDNPNNEDYEVLSLKRHCITLLLRLVSQLPQPTAAYAQSVVELAVEVGGKLSDLQQATMVGVLAALSNLATTSEEQVAFLRQALQGSIDYLASEEFKSAIESPLNFCAYVGLQSEAPKHDVEALNSPHYKNRLSMKTHITAVEGALQQVRIPSEQHSSQGPSPMFFLLAPLLPNLFLLARTLNALYEPGTAASTIHPSFGNGGEVLEMSANERQALVRSTMMAGGEGGGGTGEGGQQSSNNEEEELIDGEKQPQTSDMPDAPPAISPLIRLRSFISELTELVQGILGFVGVKLSADFYSLSYANTVDVAQLLQYTVAGVEHLPDFRLRFWLRRTWSRLLCACPAERAVLAAPMARSLSQYLRTFLVERWGRMLASRETDTSNNGESCYEPTEEDLLKETLLCLISREYCALLKSFTIVEMAKGQQKQRAQQPPAAKELLHPLGKQLLTERDILENVVAALGQMVGSLDAQASIRAAQIVTTIVANFGGSQLDEQMAAYLLIQSIRSLQLHGADEVACSPLLSLVYHLYAHLRPIYPALLEVLKQVPPVADDHQCQQAEAVQRFDERVLAVWSQQKPSEKDGQGGGEKQKRDFVKKVLRSVMGQPTSSLFKRPSVYMRNAKTGKHRHSVGLVAVNAMSDGHTNKRDANKEACERVEEMTQ